MFAAITALVKALSNSFNRWQQRKEAEQAVAIAKAEAERQLALETIKAGLQLGVTQIKATSPVFKYLTFVVWFGPFFLSMVVPAWGVQIFANLNQLPDWYVQSCMTLMFAVWGIQVGRETLANIFANLGNYFAAKHRNEFNSKLFYATLRSTKGNITQAEVDLYNAALNAAQSGKEVDNIAPDEVPASKKDVK